MGHYAGENEVRITKSPVFTALKEHFSGKPVNTELAVIERVRSLHPDKHITTVSTRSVDLLGYAKAGHAQAKLITAGDSYLSQRDYDAPASRMESGNGELSDDIDFGHYEYTWRGRDFSFYYICWYDDSHGSMSFQYILSERIGDKLHAASVDELIMACGKWSSELHDEIYVFDRGCWQKNEELWKSVQSASWNDVILDPMMKDTLINDVQGFFDSRAVYEEVHVPWKRGIIMHGTPGCGKTISIKALMHSLQEKNVASLYVKSFDSCAGEQSSIRNIFYQARVMAPCLLIFEDLDSLVKDKVDGLESNDGICMIGSTNHLERLDAGISKRPSRFDRKYHYKLPGHQERVLYCEYWRKKLSKRGDLEFGDEVCELVARLTSGFSFAYMKELFVQALLAIVGGRADDEDVDISDAASSLKVLDDSTKLANGQETTESTADDASAEKTDEVKSSKVVHKIPEVEIPEHLQDNVLLRVLKKQILALVKDMDNTDDDEDAEPKSKII
ncbi:hypothetical protein LTR17_000755 [Elasticomyces elasticus]|nr:hypothetical protein LTR17_000755 [Elasticomyces elasticus]